MITSGLLLRLRSLQEKKAASLQCRGRSHQATQASLARGQTARRPCRVVSAPLPVQGSSCRRDRIPRRTAGVAQGGRCHRHVLAQGCWHPVELLNHRSSQNLPLGCRLTWSRMILTAAQPVTMRWEGDGQKLALLHLSPSAEKVRILTLAPLAPFQFKMSSGSLKIGASKFCRCQLAPSQIGSLKEELNFSICCWNDFGPFSPVL